MRLKTLIFISTLLTANVLFAQNRPVSLLNIKQLEKRVSSKDTVYIVNFWATWCGPCVKELPNFDKLQAVYREAPLKVLLVSMDFKSKLKKEVIPFVKNHEMTSDVYLADKTNDQEFIDGIDKTWSGALPGTLVINNKKKIRKFYEKELSYDELNKIYLMTK